MIVEDEALVALDLAQQVEDLGHEVIGPAHSIQQALPLADDPTLDFALLDINLRGDHSTPIAEALLRHNVKFVFLSGYEKPQLAQDLGGIEVLSKPIQARLLEQVLEKRAAALLQL